MLLGRLAQFLLLCISSSLRGHCVNKQQTRLIWFFCNKLCFPNILNLLFNATQKLETILVNYLEASILIWKCYSYNTEKMSGPSVSKSIVFLIHRPKRQKHLSLLILWKQERTAMFSAPRLCSIHSTNVF